MRPGREVPQPFPAGAYAVPMTDTAPPDPQAPAAPATDPEPGTAPRGERIGTVLMAVAIGAVVILVVDVAMKGKLLAPLFALLPAPKAPEGEPDAGLPGAD